MTKRVIAFLGDYYHKKEWAVSAIDEICEKLPEQTIEYASVENMMALLQTNPECVILFKENRLSPEEDDSKIWMDEEVASAISNYVQKGGCWVAWHSGLASYDNIKSYTAMLRGYFIEHPAQHQLVTYIPEKDVGITNNTQKFAIMDEHYFVHCDEANTNVFLRSSSINGQSIAGWTHAYGRGQVICFTPAHLREGLQHPEVIAMLKNFFLQY